LREKALLVDGLNLLFRAFYSLPPGMKSPSGKPTNALFGFMRTLDSLNKKYQPKTIIVALDSKIPTWRKEEYPEYKAGRQETPEILLEQISYFETFLKEMGIDCFECPGHEADDVLASLAKILLKQNIAPTIVSNDKDLLQTIEKGVSILKSGRSISQIKLVTKKSFFEEYGFDSSKIPDFKGLVGDSSDNLKGVKGVGEKTAKKLLQKYGSLDEIYENINEITGSQKNKLETDKESAYFCKKLATLNSQLEIKMNEIKPFDLKEPGTQKKLKELGMTSFVSVERKPVKIKKLDYEKIKIELEKSKPVKIIPYKNSWACQAGNLTFMPEEENHLFSKKINLKDHLNKDIEIIGFDLANKHINILHSEFTNVFDLKSYAFLINSEKPSLNELWGKAFGEQAPQDPSLIFEKMKKLKDELDTKIKKIKKHYEEVEKPFLIAVERMNKTGIPINLKEVQKLEKKLEKECSKTENEMEKISGYKFNPRSPKQISELLFEKLKLKSKYGKTTNREALDHLLGHHPIIEKIILYREKHKLLSSYIKPFVQHRKKDGRIYPTFDPYGTRSGRLASKNPNFQVLPIKTKEGRMIRRCVQAEEGFSIVSIDYSQIDLRVLAHLSKDKKLMDIFKKDEDVHSQTASIMLKKKTHEITDDDRRVAKTINFGIIYGMGAASLAKQLNIDIKKSKNEIKKYFEKFHGVEKWIKETKDTANKNGYTETLDGRRRYIDGLGSTSNFIKQQAERQAVNNCVQGGSADLIKRAMVKIDRDLSDKFELILQVHDELVFHVSDTIITDYINNAKKAMEKALELGVPLKVDIKIGKKYEF
tara:strand:- start:2710 stop:5169 length:2460 start_codon:yes stop_codon:yes gene_type:complete